MVSPLYLPYPSHGTPSWNKEIVGRGWGNDLWGERNFWETCFIVGRDCGSRLKHEHASVAARTIFCATIWFVGGDRRWSKTSISLIFCKEDDDELIIGPTWGKWWKDSSDTEDNDWQAKKEEKRMHHDKQWHGSPSHDPILSTEHQQIEQVSKETRSWIHWNISKQYEQESYDAKQEGKMNWQDESWPQQGQEGHQQRQQHMKGEDIIESERN